METTLPLTLVDTQIVAKIPVRVRAPSPRMHVMFPK